VRLKDEFLANMSHELRTPLSAVLGMAEVLLEGVHGPLSAKQRRCTEVILDSGQHLLSLVNDVLDLAKIGADRLELNWQAVSAAAACRAALNLVAPAAQRKHVELVMHLPTQDPVLRADERRLRQVLVNLLSNAVKFTPEQGRVSLSLTAEPDGSGVQFAVADTGAGIRPEDLPRLFQPFVQLAHDPDQVAGGAGLGLVLVRQMVELHGGYVTVQSTLGKGTCFTVHLPCGNLSGLPGGSTGPVLRPAATGPAPSTDARPRRVLVVDDNESNLELLVDYLSAKGWCVESARSGAEALDCAAARPPDIVLMDIQMPKMTGMEAIQRLRETATGSATPVIAITALAMIGDRERCLAAGATSYLSKPISPAAVDAEMRRCLA
jgi:CheY-like chemotaxis protein